MVDKSQPQIQLRDQTEKEKASDRVQYILRTLRYDAGQGLRSQEIQLIHQEVVRMLSARFFSPNAEKCPACSATGNKVVPQQQQPPKTQPTNNVSGGMFLGQGQPVGGLLGTSGDFH